MPTITEKYLEGLQKICDALESDGWKVKDDLVGECVVDEHEQMIASWTHCYESCSISITYENAIFIAAARSAIPKLLAEVRRLRKENDK
jgi:hypothetical protein